MAEGELVVRDGTGASLVPMQTLVLTRAAAVALLPSLVDLVGQFETVTLDTHQQAKSALTKVRDARKRIEQHHVEQKRPLNQARDVALTLEREDVAPFKALETAIGARILSFEAELERQRRAEQERLQREAVEAARVEADARAKALRDAAKAEDDAKIKRALNAQARALKDAPVFVAPVEVASPIAKTSTTTRWSCDLVDVMALVQSVAAGRIPLAALEPERLIETHPWLNAQATQLREEFSIPGCIAVQKTTLTGR